MRLDRTVPARLSIVMSQPPPDGTQAMPPFGSWPRTYAVVCLLAVAVMALLWWFTARWQIPLGRA
jgi:hypothetical protein